MNLVIEDISQNNQALCLSCTVNINEIFITNKFELLTNVLNSSNHINFKVNEKQIQRIFAIAKLKKIWTVSAFAHEGTVWFCDSHARIKLLRWLDNNLAMEQVASIEAWSLSDITIDRRMKA